MVLLALAFSFYTAAQTKKVKPTKFVGQVVCSMCWDEADRNTTAYGTQADFQCAEECAANGVSQALAVKKFSGEFVLYLLEDGKFKPSGKNWLAFIAKNVEISGTLREADGKQFLIVDALKVLPVEKKPTSKLKKN
ncbi:MAG: hypothetical protein M3388_19465 [Acidobacteriota bacterium]|nr:hypothetical protein [Acidobacteriota bacterium]